MTIKNIKLKYQVVSPEGHPDAYTGRISRPLYEDMRLHPWFFGKKSRRRPPDTKKKKKKHQKLIIDFLGLVVC